MKMRVLKKSWAALVALFTTLAMALTLVSPAAVLAADYTITAPDNGHTYEVYQIFTGDYDEEDGTLANLLWGQNGTGETGTAVSSDIIDALTAQVNNNNDAEVLEVVEQYVNLNGTPFITIGETRTVTVPGGYYLIRDEYESLPEGETATSYIVEIVDNVTITPKSDTPTSQKKVQDVNDSTGETTGWQDSADYDIGDSVPFQLTFTLPNNVSAYEAYYVSFVDTLSPGLTYDDNSAVIYINGNRVDALEPAGPYADTKNPGSTMVYWTIQDITAAPYNAGDNDVITIEFTATLNEGAAIGYVGNPNNLYVDYSNNPGMTTTGRTPTDTVIVFTYETIVNKVDGDNAPLPGASFKLEKQINGAWTEVEEIATDGATEFRFTGLDDGTYRLTETATPQGYNSIDPIVFTITATHDILSDDPRLTSVAASGQYQQANGTLEGEVTFTVNKGSEGDIYTDVVNLSGSTLPETGGIGTTIFYIVGGVLVVAAIVVLVAKRRADREE